MGLYPPEQNITMTAQSRGLPMIMRHDTNWALIIRKLASTLTHVHRPDPPGAIVLQVCKPVQLEFSSRPMPLPQLGCRLQDRKAQQPNLKSRIARSAHRLTVILADNASIEVVIVACE